MLDVYLAQQSGAVLCHRDFAQNVDKHLFHAPRAQRILYKLCDQPCSKQVVAAGLVTRASPQAVAKELKGSHDSC